MKQTVEEIEKLKANWAKDPCWDIESTEGFEEHVEELRAFREEKEKQWKEAAESKKARFYETFREETGIDDFKLSQSLLTFSQIQSAANRTFRDFSNDVSDMETATIELAASQVDATLLLAAQVKRVAEALESLVRARD